MRALLFSSFLLPAFFFCGCDSQTCSTTSDCAAGEVCSESACVPGKVDPGPGGGGNGCGGPSGQVPNLLTNSGFECGTQGWAVYPGSVGNLTTTTVNPKSGTKALVVTQTATTQVVQVLSNTVTVKGPTSVCARAWMRGTAANGHLAINHGVSGKAGTEDTFSSPISADDWVLVRPSQPLKATISGDEEVTVKLLMRQTQPGETLVVDDAQLWVSADGSCSERQ